MSSEARLKKACQEIVERARLGDQNAEAILVQTRENAKKGNALAQKSHSIMLAYAKHTEDDKLGFPPKMSGDVGTASSALARLRDTMRRVRHPLEYLKSFRTNVPKVGPSLRDSANAAQAVSRGPTIADATVDGAAQTFKSPDAQNAFRQAVDASGDVRQLMSLAQSSKDPEVKSAVQAGYVMGLARRMQVVRAGGPIALYSKLAAWELGEI